MIRATVLQTVPATVHTIHDYTTDDSTVDKQKREPAGEQELQSCQSVPGDKSRGIWPQPVFS